mgnify:CR=1 FL=1
MAENPTSFDTITVTTPAPQIRLVTLNRPEAANAFNTRMAEELTGVFEALDLDPGDTRVARIKVEGFEHTCQLFGHPRVEGVRGLRPVQGDQADLRRRRGDGDRVEGCRIFSHLKLATAITRPDHKLSLIHI